MPRFHFRPFLFRRLSSKTSLKADSTTSSGSGTTAATSASSPILPGQQRPRKSSSLAQLRDKFRAQEDDTDIPQVPPAPNNDTSASVPSLSLPPKDEATTPRKARRAATSPAGSTARSGPQQDKPSSSESRLASPEQGSDSTATISNASSADYKPEPSSLPELTVQVDDLPVNPRVILEEPTPEAAETLSGESRLRQSLDSHSRGVASGEVTLVSSIEDLEAAAAKDRHVHQLDLLHASSLASSAHSLHLPTNDNTRRQSIASSTNARAITALIEAPGHNDRSPAGTSTTTHREALSGCLAPNPLNMTEVVHRKIWVKRPGASATLVQIKEDDLVDDVRDMILRKYANSLGRTFDAPDMTLRIVTRPDHTGHRTERTLGPEEEMYRTIDSHYPGGQSVDEALIIDVPVKRTPRPSPRHYNSYHAMEDLRPQENGTDYFPPMPAVIQPTLPHTSVQLNTRDHTIPADHPRSISVLSTGQIPPLPSPGGRRHRTEREHRPKYGRQHTSSPTIITHTSGQGPTSTVAPNPPPAHLHHRGSNRPRVDSSASEKHHPNGVPAAPPLPTPPAPEAPPTGRSGSTPPTPSGAVPQSNRPVRPRKTRKSTPDKTTSKARGPSMDAYGNTNGIPSVSSMLDGSVPPINVLIVEDNIINLRILEGLMKRLKVRWQTAMNGQIAVDKWKGGGYHLVLMDIQMPIMNGLQATKEIRRLERVNGIGVFSSSTPGSPNENHGDANGEPNGTRNHTMDDDRLPKADGLFKSPVIIVALTASSLQSDRHEALAAGCNDFLTKPVNFVWLERKVKEWGCMQALIDFDGWRKWKDYAVKEEEGKSKEQKTKEQEQEEKQRVKMEKLAKLQEIRRKKEEEEKKKKEAVENTSKTATVPEEPHEEAAATNDS